LGIQGTAPLTEADLVALSLAIVILSRQSAGKDLSVEIIGSF
jgi:hypothetical protein